MKKFIGIFITGVILNSSLAMTSSFEAQANKNQDRYSYDLGLFPQDHKLNSRQENKNAHEYSDTNTGNVVKDTDWDRRVASPTYGLSLLFFELRYNDRFNNQRDENIPMPGIDLRHFNGVNVSPGGGFYYGYEIGVGLNFNSSDRRYDVGDSTDTYQLDELIAFRLSFMFKHGYRFNISPDPDGFSLGLELGLGVMGGGGEVKFRHVNTNRAYNSGTAGVAPVFELGFEAGTPIRERVRLSTRLALAIGPPLIDVPYGDLSGIEMWGQTTPAFISMRVGFRMMH